MTSVGNVTKWFPNGYGFIQTSDGSEVYVNASAITDGYALTVGESVNFDFDASQTPKKPNGKMAAMNVSGPGVISGLAGVVQSYNPMKKYGFINTPDGQSYFVHSRSVQGTSLIVGEMVNFSVEDVGHESGKLQATNVQGKGVVKRGKLKCTAKNWLGKYGFVVDKMGNEIFVHVKEINGGSLVVGGDVFCDIYTKDDGHIAATNVSGAGVVAGVAPSIQQSMARQQQQQPAMAFSNIMMPTIQQVSSPMQPTLTSAGGEEMRMDTDGQFYTRTQFIEQYGGIVEFNKAPRMVAAPVGGKGRGRGGIGGMGGRSVGGGRIAGVVCVSSLINVLSSSVKINKIKQTGGGMVMGTKFNPYKGGI